LIKDTNEHIDKRYKQTNEQDASLILPYELFNIS